VIAGETNPDAKAFARAFLADLDRQSGRFGNLFWRGGPGGTTIGALARLNAGAAPETCGFPDAGANGAAMRAHPIGVIRSRSDVLRIAELQAKVTHGHPAAIEAAKAVAVTVNDALAGCEPEVVPPVGIENSEFIGAWFSAHEGIVVGAERLPAHLTDADMAGWVTVATAHAIAYVYQDDPNRAIAAAAASGADTDTVASIVGAIVGARCGAEALNTAWADGLRGAGDIYDAVEQLENL
jgi:poly(ADP-ribose) glycohydrolase ARH3